MAVDSANRVAIPVGVSDNFHTLAMLLLSQTSQVESMLRDEPGQMTPKIRTEIIEEVLNSYWGITDAAGLAIQIAPVMPVISSITGPSEANLRDLASFLRRPEIAIQLD